MIAIALVLRAEGADRRRADDRARRHDPGRRSSRCSTTWSERLGMATLLVTHDMGVVAGRTDRINVMYAGPDRRDRAETSSSRRMRHPYTQALLGSIPRLTQDDPSRSCQIPGLPPDLTNPPPGCRFRPRCPRATEQCRVEEPPLDGDAREPPVRVLAPGRRSGRARARRSRRSRRGASSSTPEGEPPARAERRGARVPRDRRAILQRKVGYRQGRLRRDRCTSTPAKRSASSASPAAARRRSAS